ncbi:hypothetical protein ACKF11_13350 [Methylobacillus sp. Pita2]
MMINWIAILNNLLQGFTNGLGFIAAVMLVVWVVQTLAKRKKRAAMLDKG